MLEDQVFSLFPDAFPGIYVYENPSTYYRGGSVWAPRGCGHMASLADRLQELPSVHLENHLENEEPAVGEFVIGAYPIEGRGVHWLRFGREDSSYRYCPGPHADATHTWRTRLDEALCFVSWDEAFDYLAQRAPAGFSEGAAIVPRS